MPRPLRIEYPGALYHVMARGNHQQAIFGDHRDRQVWLATLEEACRKTGWRIHAYVLMANHYHLLVETPEPNLSRGMKWLQSTYTSRYNRRHQLFGHLFQGRPLFGRAKSDFLSVRGTLQEWWNLNGRDAAPDGAFRAPIASRGCNLSRLQPPEHCAGR